MIVHNDNIGVSFDADAFEGDEAYEPIALGDTPAAMAKADERLRKVKYLDRRIEEVKTIHRLEQERIDEWAKEEQRKLEGTRERIAEILRSFHRALFAEDENRKTVRLPDGELVTRPGSERVEITDPEAFLASQPDDSPLVKIDRKPKKNEIREHIKATGEVLPGVKLEEGDRTWDVKPS